MIAKDASDIPFSSGMRIPGHPDHDLNARTDVSPLKWLTVFAEYQYQSASYWDRRNLVDVPEREIVNTGATFRLKREGMNASMTFEVKNLFDERITDVARYPLPGRSFFTTLRINF